MNANWQKAAPALRSLDLKLTIAIFRGYGKGWWGFNSGLVLGGRGGLPTRLQVSNLPHKLLAPFFGEGEGYPAAWQIGGRGNCGGGGGVGGSGWGRGGG